MKKHTPLILVLILCMVTTLFAGCDDVADETKKVTAAEVVAGTVQTTVLKDEELDLSGIKITLTYSDKTTEEVGFEDLLIEGEADTSAAGTYSLELTHKDSGYKFTLEYTVTEEERENGIISLRSALVTEYNANREQHTDDKGNVLEEINFMVSDDPLYVGSGNYLDFRIEAKAIDEDDNIYDVTDPETNVEVEIELEGTYTVITGDDLAKYMTVNTKGAYIDFTEEAEGNNFRINVAAKNREEGFPEKATRFTAEVAVIDGLNIYESAELAVFDNLSYRDNNYDPNSSDPVRRYLRHKDYQKLHEEFKAKYGIENIETSAIILQADMSVTKETAIASDIYYNDDTENYNKGTYWYNRELGRENIPQFIKDKLLGTPRDDSGEGVYHRIINEGETFSFVGNYFSVDGRDFPKMLTDGSSYVDDENYTTMVAHLQLFYVENPTKKHIDANVEFKNVNFYGNAERSASATNSGGMMLAKIEAVDFTAFNTITHNFYMTYLFNNCNITDTDAMYNYAIDKCRGYDSYQCLVYLSGVKRVAIIDSILKRSGGPAIIADLVYNRSGDRDHVATYIDLVNSEVESSVSGQEPWFTSYEGAAAYASQAVGLDALFGLPGATGKTIVSNVYGNVSQINLAVLMKSDVENLSNDRLRGLVRVFDSEEAYDGGNGTDYEVGLNYDSMGGAADIAYGNADITGKHPTIVVESSEKGVMPTAPYIVRMGVDGVVFFSPQILLDVGKADFNPANYILTNEQLAAMLAPMVVDGAPVPFVNGKMGYYENKTWHEIGDLISGGIAVALGDTLGANTNAFLINGYFYTGEYVNLYLPNGMGVMVKVYDKEA